MKPLNIHSDEIQTFIDRNDDEIAISSKEGREQFAEFCLTLEQNEPESISTVISTYLGKHDISEFGIVSFFANFVDKNFSDKDWHWHLKRFLLLADNAYLPLDQKTHLKKKFSETKYSSLCAALEQSVLTEAPVDFLLEGIDIKEPRQLDDKILDYLFSRQSFTQNASCNNWLSKHVAILSRRYQELHPTDALTNEVRDLLITAIVWGINQAVAFAKEHNNPKILQSDLSFDLKKISEASWLNSLDVNAKIQILLALNESLSSVSIKYEDSFGMPLDNHLVSFEPLNFCSAYPTDIMKSFTSWEVMNELVDKHPIFLKHLSSEEATANLLKRFESDPEQTRGFVKKHLAVFIESYGFDLSHYHTAYLSGGRTPTESFTFLEKVLNQQDDCVSVILGLPDNRNYKDEIKAHALFLIKTAAAYRAIWSLYEEHCNSKQDPYCYRDVLAILIDRDENFDFDGFCQLALNNERIAFQLMQVESKRLKKFLEYKPEMLRELFKKHPQIISRIKGNVLKAAFAQQENLISLIPADSGYDDFHALRALLAINTPSSMEKAKEQIRSFSVKEKLSISALFQEFNHAFIIHFLKESFNKDELNSVFTTEFLCGVNHEFQIKPLNTKFSRVSKLSVEMADFLLEYIAEKTNFSPDESHNYKPLQHFFEDCLFLLNQSQRITLEEIFSKYSHQIFGENFRYYETWECELTILLLEKIKRESGSLLDTYRSNRFLKNEDKKEIDDTTLKNLIALLPQEINNRLRLHRQKIGCFFYLDSSELDQEVSRLQEKIQCYTTTEDTKKTPVIQKSDALFASDYAVLRQGIHAYYRQEMLEKTDDLFIVGDILADAKIAILTKLKNALEKIDPPAEAVQSVLTHCTAESFFPSRLALEDVLKELSLEELVLNKLLDQCSDEILPALLQDSVKQLIFTQEKTDEQTPLIAFLNAVYKDYPQGWARVLIKVLEGYKTYPHHEWIKGMVFALGILREPLGDKAPKILDKISKDAAFVDLSEVIHRQKMLFNRENFNRGHFKKPQRRVAEALQNLIRTHQKIT